MIKGSWYSQLLVKYDQETNRKGEKLPEDQKMYRAHVVLAFMESGIPLTKLNSSKLRELLEENVFHLTYSWHLLYTFFFYFFKKNVHVLGWERRWKENLFLQVLTELQGWERCLLSCILFMSGLCASVLSVLVFCRKAWIMKSLLGRLLVSCLLHSELIQTSLLLLWEMEQVLTLLPCVSSQ